MCFPYVAVLKLRPNQNPTWEDPQVLDKLSRQDPIFV